MSNKVNGLRVVKCLFYECCRLICRCCRILLVSELFKNEHADDSDNPSDYQDDCDTGQCE